MDRENSSGVGVKEPANGEKRSERGFGWAEGQARR